MPTFIVLLRGVNVGRGNRVPMAAFRELLSDLGYTDVVTLLNSGNAVFRSTKSAPAKHADAIAAALADRLSVEVPVIVKSAKELAAIVAENPIPTKVEDHSRFLVTFTQDARSLATVSAAIEPLVVPPEKFATGRNAAYLLCANGILESKAGAALLGKPGKQATTRNWATTLKLHALASKERDA